jgi:hypothetical protein
LTTFKTVSFFRNLCNLRARRLDKLWASSVLSLALLALLLALDITVLIGGADEPQLRVGDGFAKSAMAGFLGNQLVELVLLFFACVFLFAGDRGMLGNSSSMRVFFVGVFGPTPTCMGVEAFSCSSGFETIPVTAALKTSISCWELSTKCWSFLSNLFRIPVISRFHRS